MTRELIGSLRLDRSTLALHWLAVSLAWAAVIFLTEQPAWPLALWIAATVGPLTKVRDGRHHASGASAGTVREGARR